MNLARLLGETGPISDFSNWQKLMRYFGLNIRMRQSGKYQGQYKITKKGRPLGRKALDNIILPLVKKGCLYGIIRCTACHLFQGTPDMADKVGVSRYK